RTPDLACAVDNPLSCKREVLRVARRYRRLRPDGIKALPVRRDQRIVIRIVTELKNGTFSDVQISIRLKHNGSCEPEARRYEQRATSCLAGVHKGIVDCFSP